MSTLDILQVQRLKESNDAFHAGSESCQSKPYGFTAHDGRSYIEKYLNFGMSLALKCVPHSVSGCEFPPASFYDHSLVEASVFILYVQSKYNAIKNWEDDLVLVEDVQLVQGPQGIIPSRVGLYIVEDDISEHTPIPYFFNPVDGIFNRFPRLSNWELGVAGDFYPQPSVKITPNQVKSGSKIVNNIPDNGGNILREQRIKWVVEKQLPGIFVNLSDGAVEVINKRFQCGIKLTDVLFGPFYLEPRSGDIHSQLEAAAT